LEENSCLMPQNGSQCQHERVNEKSCIRKQRRRCRDEEAAESGSRRRNNQDGRPR
jgi:hypothetical protein